MTIKNTQLLIAPIRILLIEDNPGDARLIEEYFNELEGLYEVNVKTSMGDGITLQQKNASDLILLDLSLPDSKGLDTFLSIQKIFPETPIVVLTGFDDEFTARKAVSEGAQDYLVKDQVNGQILAHATRYAIDRQEAGEKIRESEKNLSLIYDTAGDVLFQLSVEPKNTFRFKSVNNAFIESTGIPKEQIVWKVIDEIIPEPSLSLAKKKYKEAIKKKKTMRWEEITEYPTGVRIGSVTITPAFNEKGKCTHLIGSVHDITELREIEEEKRRSERQFIEKISKQLQRISALREIDTAISSSMDIGSVIQVVLEKVRKQLGMDVTAIYLLDHNQGLLKFAWAMGAKNNKRFIVEFPLGAKFAGLSASEKKMFYSHNLREEKIPRALKDFVVRENFVFYAVTPLLSKGSIKGVLEVFLREDINPDQDWFDYFETLAGQAAIAIQDAELINNLRDAKSELEVAYSATLKGWVDALDLRDNETEGHTQRVTDMTFRLASSFGLKSDELIHITRGALLHDIGKIGIPDSILLKPGKLNDEEWLEMKKHPVYAYDFLKTIDYLKPVLDIPRYHHEKWDGSGYPKGLKGNDIPLAARIFSIVDVWDALRSDRPYRKAWSKEKTKKYIREQEGKHFDPEIVALFFSMINSIQ